MLTKCFQEFDHEIGNADLFLIRTVNNVLTFYSTPIRGVNSLDALANSDKLPKNLHVVQDGYKYNPDTDTFFEGFDAFPKKALIEDGIKGKKKYDNIKAQIDWPDI